MGIWTQEFSLDDLNKKWPASLHSLLDFEIIEILEDGLVGKMPLSQNAKQPFGALHGGVTCYLAESLASIGANLCMLDSSLSAVGMSLTASHVRGCFEGFVTIRVNLLHRGRSTQVWSFSAYDSKQQLLSTGSVTTAVISQKRN